MPDPTDGELVARARRGDGEAYGTLVSRYQGHVYGLAYSLVDDWAEAQDIAQDAFVRAYLNLDQLHDPERFAAWLRRVTFSVAMNWLKAFRPELFRQLDGNADLEVLEIPDFRPGPPEVVEKRELAEAVGKAVASLPPKYRLPLTMFHLDGLSYERVAGFLDIPTGHARVLLHRARQKLKVLLAPYITAEVSPVIQEVFDAQKLPAEFARVVLEHLPSLGWEKGESTFCGAVVACLEYRGEPVPYDLVMGLSGHAFRLRWARDWRSHDGLLAEVTSGVASRTLRGLGYEWELISRTDGHEPGAIRDRVVASLHAGRPVIIDGGLGPRCCVVAGYDGEALLGRTFFDESEAYARAGDWQRGWQHIVFVGDRCEPPAAAALLRGACTQAVTLAETREDDGLVSGLGAYDAWAADLLSDDAFPPNDPETLTWRCHVSHSLVLAGLWDARRAAAAFLHRVGADAAAGAYEAEHELLSRTMKLAPFCHESEARRQQIAGRALRLQLADLIQQAKQHDARAIALLAQRRTAAPAAATQ